MTHLNRRALLAARFLLPTVAIAQSRYPARPIRIVVP